jgi:hypothetical protein
MGNKSPSRSLQHLIEVVSDLEERKIGFLLAHKKI